MRYLISNTKVVLVFILLIIITSLIGIIFLVDQNGKVNTPSSTNLKSYDSFKNNFNNLNLNKGNSLSETINQFKVLENPTNSPDIRYGALVQISDSLIKTYIATQNPKIYSFIANDLNIFAKVNFSKNYKQTDFASPCMDPQCEIEPAPKEILSIINEIRSINSSFVSAGNKEGQILNLKSSIYNNSKNRYQKAILYMNAANQIRADEEFQKANLNNKIADEIINFVKNRYPEEYNILKNQISQQP